jgi:hypothetical protein
LIRNLSILIANPSNLPSLFYIYTQVYIHPLDKLNNFIAKSIYMYETIQTIHSYWAYLALLLLVIAIINGFLGILRKKEFVDKDRKIAFFAMLATHIQFLIGVVVLFLSPYWSSLMDTGMGEAMGNSLVRLYTVEHPLTNIIAIALITIGWSRHKKATQSPGKFKSITYLYLAGLLLLLSRIPWEAWMS